MNEILLVNPRRRRKTTTRRKRRKTTVRRRRRRNPVAAVSNPRRRRRRNPQRITAVKIQRQLTVATQGALGALGLDIALAYIPFPAQMSGPFIGPVIKGFGAVALGVLVNMAGVRADTANRMVEGALTVQIHGIAKTMLGQFMPAIPLSAYTDQLGYYGSGWNPNAIVDDPDWNGSGMSAYLTDISADPMTMDEGGMSMYEDSIPGGGAGFAW